ncbi:MAG: low molecular weight protein arginine phosphatase [Clostridiales bacterium]|nr:low molecular weight protein arginine phosphatase [Clostridiales bacterium]
MNVLFVCAGNTCRSPMAEAIARDILKKRRLTVEVSSAGMAALPGSPASAGALMAMASLGLDLSGHRSRRLERSLLEPADIVLTMTEDLKRLAQTQAPNKDKVCTLREYAGETGDIPDPYGGGDATYLACASELLRLIEIAAERMSI